MKKLILPFCGLFLMMSLSGCGLMEDAFKAGIFFGVIIIAVIAIIIWLVRITAKQLEKAGILDFSERQYYKAR